MSSEHTSPCHGCALAGPALAGLATRDIDRRQFLSAATLAAISAMLSACHAPSTAPLLQGQTTLNVLDYTVLQTVGGVVLVTLSGAPLAIVRVDATSFLALSRRCPHQGTEVNTDPAGGFICPNHGARFNEVGQWIGGEPTTNMTRYPTVYDSVRQVLTIN
jgi:nitrite reductase/ring-hydroxylating ferredoxin subunit